MVAGGYHVRVGDREDMMTTTMPFRCCCRPLGAEGGQAAVVGVMVARVWEVPVDKLCHVHRLVEIRAVAPLLLVRNSGCVIISLRGDAVHGNG